MSHEYEPQFTNPNLRTVIAPDRPGNTDVITAPGTTAPEKGKPSQKKRNVLIGSVAGVALAAGAVFGVTAIGTASESTPVATAAADPAETPTPTPTPEASEALTVEALRIPAGLTPDQVGTLLVNERLTQWDMASATPDVQNEWLTGIDGVSIGVVEYAQQEATKNADLFTSAMFVDGWQQDPKLVDFVESQKKQNAAFLGGWLATYDSPYPEDLEAFTVSNTAESTTVVSQADDATTYEIHGTMHANADKNRIGQQNPDALRWNNDRYLATVTLVPAADGSQRIAEIAFSPDKS